LASTSLFALYVSGTSYWAVVQDVVPNEVVGRISGLTHFVANLGGIAAPALTGLIVAETESFRLGWLAAAGLCMLAVASVAVVGLVHKAGSRTSRAAMKIR